MGKIRENSIDYNTIQHGSANAKPGVNINQYPQNERVPAYHRRAQTRGVNHQLGQPIAESKSPDKYTINNNKNLVVNLNDSAIKPVKRENSNATNTTHVTGITASTAGTQNTKNNAAFHNTQYKAGVGKAFFPTTGGPAPGASGRNAAANNFMTTEPNNYDEASQKMSQGGDRQG